VSTVMYLRLEEGKMPQESLIFDYQHLIREPSTSFKLYVLFLLASCVVTGTKLIRVWRAAPPFRLSRRANSPEYLELLRRSRRSLKQWIGLIFLSYGILFSTSLYDVCNRLLGDNRWGSEAILLVVEDYATGLNMALWVVVFVFLARWHMLKRIERLTVIDEVR
jgi:hypothetical protein